MRKWVQTVINANNIVGRKQTSKLMVSPKENLEKHSAAYYLGLLKPAFKIRMFMEENVNIAEKTHFI